MSLSYYSLLALQLLLLLLLLLLLPLPLPLVQSRHLMFA